MASSPSIALFAYFALPLIAAGAAAVGVSVPLLIHLLSRQRYQVVPWAAIRFLMASQKQHRRRIDRWLLLISRMLIALFLLAGMIATMPWAEELWQSIRPGPPEVVSNAPRTHRILVVDASLSLSTHDENRTRFAHSLELVEQAIQSANPGDGFTLIYLTEGAEAIVPGPSNDPESVLAEVRKLSVTHGTADLAAGVAMVADTLTRSPRIYPRKQVLLFTDLQRSAWAGLLPNADGSAPEIWQKVLGRADFAVVDSARHEVGNLAVTSLTLSDPLPFVGEPAAVLVTVENFGTVDRSVVRLELQLGRPSAAGVESTLVPIEQRVIERIEAGKRVTIPFTLDGASRFSEAGLHLLRARLVEGDDLPADDQRSLAVTVRDGLKVLLVNGTPAVNPSLRATEYLSEAFAPGGRTLPGNPARPRTISLSEFADPVLGNLDEVDCLFLCDVPMLSSAQIARIDAFLKRGGGVVVGAGPNMAENKEWYNRVLFRDGKGLLPGIRISDPVPRLESGYRLLADDTSFRRPPLAAFRDDNSRAGLTSVPFQTYLRLDAPMDGAARRVLSFVPDRAASPKAEAPREETAPPDPAVVEWPHFRGRVVLYTGSFNRDWTDWPVLPSFLPFVHELLRFASTNPDRHTLLVGEAIEDYVPPGYVGLTANVIGPDGRSVPVTVQAGDGVGVVRVPTPRLSGLYRLSLGGVRDVLFAVNVPESTPGGGSESDLRKLNPDVLRSLGKIPVVTDPSDVGLAVDDPTLVTILPRPHGPTLARWFLSIALLLVVVELWLAWRFGPARTALAGTTKAEPATGSARLRRILGLSAMLPLILAIGLLAALAHAYFTDEFLGFLPEAARHRLELLAGVPGAEPGEGIRWRLESSPVYLQSWRQDRRLLFGVGLTAIGIIFWLYRRERRASRSRLLLPLGLRIATIALLVWMLLPQSRIVFDREGWPDIAVLLDTSASMATVDDLRDPKVRAKADELKQLAGLTEINRLQLALALLSRPDGDFLTQLLTERRLKVHLYSVADRLTLLNEIAEANDVATAKESLTSLKADGDASRLGDAVQAVLKAFRGGSLAAMIVFTDGITTAGEDLPQAAQEASRANVPLYLVGLGDSRDPTDLALADLKVDDVVLKGDTLIFEARLIAKGTDLPPAVPVTLYERKAETLVELAQETVTPDPSGKPVTIRFHHTPTEVGEKTYVLDLPVQPNEAEPGNNRLERVIVVTENRKLRVLYLDGYPRYEFRFVKTLLERESDATIGNKSIELRTLLLDASPGYADQDKSALRSLPTKSELLEYDVVILGDIDPTDLKRSQSFFQDLLEFVKVRGGGLLLLAGSHFLPEKLFTTPLAELMPLVPSPRVAPGDTALSSGSITEGYLPKPTPFGQTHPIFKLAPDPIENTRIWSELQPLLWYATGYQRKPSAEVLATHPTRPAEGYPGEQHPLILQLFVGAGRVVFFGFDETWRWRFRQAETHFNDFWYQTVRVLARSRITRPELRTDKQTAYRRDEPIRITVRFPDDAPAPAENVPVKVLVERSPLKSPKGSPPNGSPPGGLSDSQSVQLAKVEGTRATYATLLTRTPEGEYRFYLTEPETTGNPPRAEAKVLPPPGEKERLEMNRPDLIRAASESRGKFYTLADVEQLIADLPDAPRIPLNQPVPPIPLWNHAILFALLLILLGTEWMLRRRERLL